jgi:hypothetical protein
VLLAAGALLEDTQLPRLVAQLKFVSVSPRVITSLSVNVRYFTSAGTEETVTYTYDNLAVRSGQSFGQYRAIVLPADAIVGFTAEVTSAAFASAPARAPQRTESAPAQQPIAAPVHEPAPEPIPEPFAPAEAQRTARVKPRRKGLTAVIIAVLAAAAVTAIAFLLFGGGGGGAPPASVNADNPSASGGATATPAGEDNAPTPPSDAPSASTPVPSATPVRVTTPTDRDTVVMEFTADSEGLITLTLATYQENYPQATIVNDYFPEAKCVEITQQTNVGNNIDEYLKNTFFMALMVSEGYARTNHSQLSSTIPKGNQLMSLFIFSDATTVCGYFIGYPENNGDDVWRFAVTACNYDFGELFRQEVEDFSDAEWPRYISPEDITTSGAEWFLAALSYEVTSDNEDAHINFNLYYFWHRMNSLYFKQFLRPMNRFDDYPVYYNSNMPEVVLGRHFMLFDGGYNLIGYTLLTNE